MALSSSVEESLQEAQSNLRNALAYAARNERVIVCDRIAKLLADIDNISSADALFDTLEHLKDLKEGDDNTFPNN